MSAHQGLLEGVDNAPEIRDLILQRLKAFTTTGLGDEDDEKLSASGSGWSPEHVTVLRELRDLVAR